MNRQISPTRSTTQSTQPRVHTVGFCDVDPDKIVDPTQVLPVGSAASLLLTYSCPEAIDAALRGEVDILVVDGNEVTTTTLTALSFLRRERPEVSVFLYLEEHGSNPRLQLWDSVH